MRDVTSHCAHKQTATGKSFATGSITHMEIPDDQVGSKVTWPSPSPVPDSCRSAAEGRRLRSTDSLFHRLWELCRNKTQNVKTDVCNKQAIWAFQHILQTSGCSRKSKLHYASVAVQPGRQLNTTEPFAQSPSARWGKKLKFVG